jgi:hypothetical protein
MSKPRVIPVSAMAVATVTIEVRGLGSWGTDCSLEQVHRQAREAAIGYLRNLDKDRRFTIVGQPEIKTIIAERQP